MQNDEIINCPRTNGDLCYKTEVSKGIYSYLSLSCGFYSNTLLTEGSEFYEQTVVGLPELHKELAWKDPETGLVWFPNLIKNELGMIYAGGTSVDNWGWAVVKQVEIPETDQKNHPIPGKPGKYMTHRPDMANIKYFPERDYIGALEELGVLPK